MAGLTAFLDIFDLEKDNTTKTSSFKCSTRNPQTFSFRFSSVLLLRWFSVHLNPSVFNVLRCFSVFCHRNYKNPSTRPTFPPQIDGALSPSIDGGVSPSNDTDIFSISSRFENVSFSSGFFFIYLLLFLSNFVCFYTQNFNCSSHQMLLICFVMLITNQIIMLCLLFWVLEEEEAPPELDIDEIENLLYRGDSAIPIVGDSLRNHQGWYLFSDKRYIFKLMNN